MSDAGAPEEVALRDDELALSDRKRLQQIFSARRQAADALREVPIRQHQLASQLVREHAAAAVRAYILEADPLYRGTGIGRDYWRSADLGDFRPLAHVKIPTAPPWAGEHDRWEVDYHISDTGDLPCEPDSTDGAVTVRYEGVRAFVDAPVPTPVTVEVEWERRTHNGLPTVRDSRPTSTTISANVSPPVHVSEAAYRVTNNLLAAVGIGLEAEVDDSEPDWDYSDLV